MNTKGILMSILMIGVVAMAAGAGTFAYFSDTETSSENTFTAGTMDLKYSLDANGDGDFADTDLGDAQDIDGGNAAFTLSNLKPDDSGSIRYVLTNDGSIEGSLDVNSISASHSEGTNVEAESDTAEEGDLGDDLKVLIWFDDDDDGEVDTGEKLVYADGDTDNDGVAEDGESIVAKDIGDLSGANTDNDVTLAANGGNTVLRIDWELPSDTVNDVMGDEVDVDITFELLQQAD